MKKTFALERDKVTGEWRRRLLNEELNDLHASPDSGDQIKKNGMGGACSTYGRRREVRTGFRWVNVREIDHLEDPSIDERIILRWIFKKWNGGGGMEWIELA
jgi:hypothetical protein